VNPVLAIDGMPVIPPEIKARIEAIAFLEAIREGDYAGAARAQERIQKHGYFIGRAPEKRPARKPPRQPREAFKS
jgi:hypothetical protein